MAVFTPQERDRLAKSIFSNLCSREHYDKTKGRWVTIKGAHVKIDDDGTVVACPPGLLKHSEAGGFQLDRGKEKIGLGLGAGDNKFVETSKGKQVNERDWREFQGGSKSETYARRTEGMHSRSAADAGAGNYRTRNDGAGAVEFRTLRNAVARILLANAVRPAIENYAKERWVTIGAKDGDGGTHVKLDESGNIIAGPSSLTGKNVGDLPNKGLYKLPKVSNNDGVTKEATGNQPVAQSPQAVKEPGMNAVENITVGQFVEQAKAESWNRKKTRDKIRYLGLGSKQDEILETLGFAKVDQQAAAQNKEIQASAEAAKLAQSQANEKARIDREAKDKEEAEKAQAAKDFKSAQRQAEIGLQKNVEPHWPTYHRVLTITKDLAEYFDARKYRDVKDMQVFGGAAERMANLFQEVGVEADSSAADIFQSVMKYNSISPAQAKALAVAASKAATISGVGKGDIIGESPARPNPLDQHNTPAPSVRRDESAKIDTTPVHYVTLIGSKKTAEKPYLAKIGPGFSREFVKGRKYTNSSKSFNAELAAGDVVEWRAHSWESDEGSYVGGRANAVMLHDGIAVVSPNTARQLVDLKGQGWQPYDQQENGDLLLRKDGQIMQFPQQGDRGIVQRRKGNDFAEVGGLRVSPIAKRDAAHETEVDQSDQDEE